MPLPPILPRDQVRERLKLIFPEGTQRRSNVTSQVAASTVFVALYIGAVEGSETLLQPKPIYRMTEEQSRRVDERARLEFIAMMRRPRGFVPGERWYQDNSREGIRDDTIREGFVTLGAFVQQTGVAVTANRPRYVMSARFAALFDPSLSGAKLEAAANTWRTTEMSPGALVRIALARQGAGAGGDRLLITFPNGETRRMRPGPSAPITKAVVEVFAPRFLRDPAIVALSDSGDKVFDVDIARVRHIGLHIRPNQDLPDVIIVDLGRDEPLLVFVEVVATDGPISERRKRALQSIATEAGFALEHVAFVSAFLDRGMAPFKKAIGSLAWGSYAWFVSEPDGLLDLSINRTTIG